MSLRQPATLYRVYGLHLHSTLPLTSVPVSSGQNIDLAVYVHKALPRPSGPPPRSATVIWHEVQQQWRLCYHASDGERLEFVLNRQATQLDIFCTLPEVIQIAAVTLGLPLAAALYLRGVPVLHAAAVMIERQAILIAGMSGAGKSTLTAALVAQGRPFLVDDLAALAFSPGHVSVQSGHPRLRLCPDALGVLGHSSTLPRVFSQRALVDKRWLDTTTLPGGFHPDAAPLQSIYILAPRQQSLPGQPLISSLPLHRAGLALFEHLYGRHWLRIPPAQALVWCAAIASRTRVHLVHAPQGLQHVADTAAAIVADARRYHDNH